MIVCVNGECKAWQEGWARMYLFITGNKVTLSKDEGKEVLTGSSATA